MVQNHVSRVGKNSQSQLPSATINVHVIRSRSGSQRTLFLSTRLNPLTWWVYPPYSVWSSSCWSFVFAGPHRSDLLNIKAVHVHLTYEDSTVRGGPFGISNLFLYRILSLCCLYFAICLFLTPLVLTDHSTSPHASSYEAMVLQFGLVSATSTWWTPAGSFAT